MKNPKQNVPLVIQAVNFWTPSWRSLKLSKGSLNHPEKVTKNYQVKVTAFQKHPQKSTRENPHETKVLNQKSSNRKWASSFFWGGQVKPIGSIIIYSICAYIY